MEPKKLRHVADASEMLHLALRCSLVRLLRLEELLAILNSCSLLRRDAVLVRQSVAHATDFGWFPEVLTDIAALASDSRRLHQLWGRGGSSSMSLLAAGNRANVHLERPVRVLALAVFLQKRIMHWCFVYEPLNPESTEDMLCSVRPALIPIKGYELRLVGGLTDAQMLEHLRTRLNAMHRGFGDSFTGMASATGSCFGSHWDNIRINQESGQKECTLCLAAAHSVAFYRRQTALFIERYNQKLVKQQHKWTSEDGKTALEMDALTEVFRLAHFPNDAYIALDSQRWSSAVVLQHVCRHGKFQFEGPFGSVCRSSVSRDEDLLASLSPKNYRQCRRFYQPLREQLLRRSKFVGRAQLLLDRNDQSSLMINALPRVAEFVGGLDAATGALCGVYCNFC